MTPVSNHNDPHQPPTGNLEELFRQKLAEAELAPRADVWDRLDHELLLRENQGYRRRLVGYRRLAAAACAVATLGIGGWLTQHALTSQQPTELAAAPAGRAVTEAAARLSQAANAAPAASRATEVAAGNGTDPAGEAAQASRTSTTAAAGSVAAAVGRTARPGHRIAAATTETLAAAAPVSQPGSVVGKLRDAFGVRRAAASQTGLVNRALATIKRTFGAEAPAAVPGGMLNRTLPAADAAGNIALAGTASRSSLGVMAAEQGMAEDLAPVASRLRRAGLGSSFPDSLKASLPGGPTLLAAQAPAEEPSDDKKSAPGSRWRWRGSYAAQRFAPNVSSLAGSGMAFRTLPTPVPAGVGSTAPRAANLAEPTQLQAGLAQRGQLGVVVPLGKKHWSLLTGAEVALVSGRTDREIPKQFNLQTSLADQKFQTGRYQLTTLGVPAQVRYESRRQGWGVYAAVGAAVNVLLRNRTAVGLQSTSDDDSYRRVQAAVRGNAGLRFSPLGRSWQFNVGPEAEAGLTTLNTDPAGSWAQRTRPYAFGLAASVEFGSGKPEVAP